MNLRERYAAIEAKTAAFSAAAGIACPPGCGECCEAVDFAVSRAEADAVAEYLAARPALLERFLAQPPHVGKTRCPLYDAENAAAHCTVYEARPLLCRTFAFAAHRDKRGDTEYAPCRRFRETEEGEARVEAAKAGHREGKLPALPVLPDEAVEIAAGEAGGEAMQMGPAVMAAVERVELRRRLSAGNG